MAKGGTTDGRVELCSMAVELGWVLDKPDGSCVLFADGFGASFNVSLTIGPYSVWLETPEGDVTVDLQTYRSLPTPKAAAEFIRGLQ